MNEQFDADLSRALKQGAGQGLQGWEFTPAMRRNVLTRIRAEETGTAAPPAGRRPFSVPRPLIWATVAAAAFVLALQIDLGGVSSQKESTPMAAQAPAAPAETKAAPASGAATGQAESAPPTGGVATKEAPKSEEKMNVRAYDSSVPPRTVQIRLEAPTVSTAATALTAPAAAKAMVAAPRYVAADGTGPYALVLSSRGLEALRPDGEAAWLRPLEAVNEQSALAVDADGRAAVSAGQKVFVVGRDGALERSFDLTGPATGLAWSPDGRLAAAHGPAVTVYRDGKSQFSVPASPGAHLAFGPDGSLAVLDNGNLAVFDRSGRSTARLTGLGAQTLAFSQDGQTILTADAAYSLNLEKRWAMPLQARAVQAVNPGLVVVWSADQVMGLRPADGAVLWQASREGAGAGIERVAVSLDGGTVAVVVATDTGATLWVFRPTGEIRLIEALTAMPAGLAFNGNDLLLLMPQGPMHRAMPQ